MPETMSYEEFYISIHAPREGGDSGLHRLRPAGGDFNPRPREGGDNEEEAIEKATDISIHAPREGGDKQGAGQSAGKVYFNPRPPRGGRLRLRDLHRHQANFNPRPPARGATIASISL